MSKSTLKEILAAVGVLKGADPTLVAAVSNDIRLEKAAEHSENLEGREWIEDNWSQGNVNKAPTKEQIKTGPREASSGEGAERMIRDYADPAPQHGITLTAEAMARMLGPINSSMKAVAEALKANTALLLAMKAEEEMDDEKEDEKEKARKARVSKKSRKAPRVRKADADHEDEAEEEDEEEEEEDEEESEEESEVVEINAAKANTLLKKARAKIRRAKILKAEAEEDAEDGEEEEKCKSKLRRARALRKSAARLLAKAQTCAYAAGNDDLKIAVRTVITKADINVVQEEEEEEDEEEEEESEEEEGEEETKARKAKGSDARGNQTDRQDPKNGNQAADAVKSIATRVDEALKGVAMLQTDVKGLMSTIAGQSKFTGQVPDLLKAKPVDVKSVNEEIAEMVEHGSLSDTEAFAARDLVSKIELAKAGKIDAALVNDRILKTTGTVRNLLNRIAAAA